MGVGFLQGYGLKSGAVATSISHDSHNIIVVGASEEDCAAAVNRVVELNGGIVVWNGGRPAAEVSLAIGGIMSDEPLETVNEKLDLLSAKLGRTHNSILSRVYQIMERDTGAVLEDERIKAIETYSLGECSILTAVFYNEKLKASFEDIIDFNLAPENRGW